MPPRVTKKEGFFSLKKEFPVTWLIGTALMFMGYVWYVSAYMTANTATDLQQTSDIADLKKSYNDLSVQITVLRANMATLLERSDNTQKVVERIDSKLGSR